MVTSGIVVLVKIRTLCIYGLHDRWRHCSLISFQLVSMPSEFCFQFREGKRGKCSLNRSLKYRKESQGQIKKKGETIDMQLISRASNV